MKNKNLHNAKAGKNDEFYTQYSAIEKELQHYEPHFKGKVVYCNCDSENSNFVKYFVNNYSKLELKGLSFSGMPNVDFRSDAAIERLKQADIVVTNPPFSLFREYVAQLIEYDKKFLIIGNMNAITYKEIFPLIKDNKLWLGINNGVKKYVVPNDYDDKKYTIGEDGKKYISMGNTNWFTNLEHNKRNEEIILYKNYTPKEYPKYDNYDAINVDKVKDIPCDYFKVMGVPITFLDKHNPEQFEIVGNEYILNIEKGRGYVNGKRMYSRIFIKNKTTGEVFNIAPSKDIEWSDNINDYPILCSGVMGVPITFLDKFNPNQFEIVRFRKGDNDKDLCINGKCPYFRILIRNK